MKHFTTEEWIDLVNQTTPSRQQTAMRKHLQSGCKACAKELALWERVRSTAAKESQLQPPDAALRKAKAAFAASALSTQREERGSLIEVLFDSFLQPALAGARSAAMGSRQMLYRAGALQIDIQVEAKPGSNALTIAGQIMDVSTPEFVSAGVQIMLSNLRGSVVHTHTNEFGEFRGEVENSGDLELCVPGRGDEPITISLRNALGRLPGDRT